MGSDWSGLGVGKEPEFMQAGEDDVCTLLNRFSTAIDHDLRMKRFFVRVGHAGKLLNLTGEGFLIEPFHVAGDKGVQRAFNVHFHKVANALAHFVADRAIRGNCGGNGDGSVAGQEMRDIADTADVGIAVLFAEPQPLTEVGPHFIAVKNFYPFAPLLQLADNGVGKGRFARPRQTREPQGKTTFHRVSAPLSALDDEETSVSEIGVQRQEPFVRWELDNFWEPDCVCSPGRENHRVTMCMLV